MTERAAILCRCSTDDQQENGESLDVQEREGRAWSRTRGYTVSPDLVFREAYTGSRSGERAELLRLMRAITDRCVDVVVAPDVKRIGRNTIENSMLLEVCRAFGVRLEVVGRGVDYTRDDDTEFEYDIETLLAKRDGRHIRRNTMRGRREANRRGHVAGGPAPFGYRREGERGRGTYVPNDAAPWVRSVFELYAGGRGYRWIARWLNGQGVYRFPRKTPPPKWERTQVATMLRNRVYIGYLRWGGEEVQGRHPPLVPLDLWNQVQERRAAMRERHPGRPASLQAHLPEPRLPRSIALLLGKSQMEPVASASSAPEGA